METRHQQHLLKIIKAEIKKAEKLAVERRETAKSFRTASRSQQGDRRLFETAADLAESKYQELIEFKKELEKVPGKANQNVSPFSRVTVKYESGQTAQFYFVTQRIQLPGIMLITNESPIGKAIESKKTGQKFTYQIDRDGKTTSVSGEIIKIE